MSKFIPLLFCLFVLTASCSHSNLEAHFQKSQTGWSKEQVFRNFGTPDDSFEDSSFKYYVYKYVGKPKTYNNDSVIWNVKYVFKSNKVVEVLKERQPTAQELDKLQD